MIRVLVVDDSSFMRVKIKSLLEEDPGIRAAGIARTGQEAVEKALLLKPDVITMDIHMPDMSGIQAVERIMQLCPTPVVMISAFTADGTADTVEALEKGAVDTVDKARMDGKSLTAKVRMAARALIGLPARSPSAPAAPADPASFPAAGRSFSVIGIGISTGGPKALSRFLPELSPDLSAGIVIAQHMPPDFIKTLAARLDAESKIRVKEAVNGEVLHPGCAYLCPGGLHIKVRPGGTLSLYPKSDFPQYYYVPSADILMASLGRAYGAGALCVIMTGMGSDGLEGIRSAREQGSYILAQSEDSCTIYGMPKAVITNHLPHEILSLDDMGARINQLCGGH